MFMFKVLLAALGCTTMAYDVGCLYPLSMPDPLDARRQVAIFLSSGLIAQKTEIPVAADRAFFLNHCGPLCIATHDDSALSILTKKRPKFVTPPFGHNSFSRMLCTAQCYAFVFEINGQAAALQPIWNSWGLNVSKLDPTLVDAAEAGNDTAIRGKFEEAGYSPFVVGQYIGWQVNNFFKSDGWNRNGERVYDLVSNSAVPCTANCIPYADVSGYRPVNPPRKPMSWNKYHCTGRCRRWQPLVEADVNGNIKRQDHVTPYIGATARRFVRRRQRRVRNPRYNYRREGLKVVDRLRITASNRTRQRSIGFFDDTLTIRALIFQNIIKQFPDHSFENHIMFVYWLFASEIDALLQTYSEKIRWDLVRPTAVIQRWVGDMLNTYNGDRKSTGPSVIAARDFQAFQRVTPTSEYPSATAALCTAYAEFTNAFTAARYQRTMGELRVGPNDFNVGCNPPRPFRAGCTEADRLAFKNMNNLRDVCRQSRLWGGMHFTAAVNAGGRLVAGLGKEAFLLEDKVRNGSTWGSSFRKGGPRPTCVSAQ